MNNLCMRSHLCRSHFSAVAQHCWMLESGQKTCKMFLYSFKLPDLRHVAKYKTSPAIYTVLRYARGCLYMCCNASMCHPAYYVVQTVNKLQVCRLEEVEAILSRTDQHARYLRMPVDFLHVALPTVHKQQLRRQVCWGSSICCSCQGCFFFRIPFKR